jgi:hypothetical protein
MPVAKGTPWWTGGCICRKNGLCHLSGDNGPRVFTQVGQ